MLPDKINELKNFIEGPICIAEFESNEDKLVIVQINKQSEFADKISSLCQLIEPKSSPTEEIKIDESLNIKVLSALPKWVENCVLNYQISNINTAYYLIDNNFWFLSTNKELLKESYLKIVRGNVVANNSAFKSLKTNFSSKENSFKYSLNQPLKILNNSKYRYDFGSQIEYKDTTILASVVIKEPITPTTDTNIVWKNYLDSTLIKVSQPLINKKMSTTGMLLQDSKNNLYLINTAGRILWKRAIDEPIVNNIIPYSFKNEASFIFTTPKKLYQIDFSGNFVGNYPILLNDHPTSDISLFDYENNGDFRIFIPTENKKIQVFDNRGNLVLGFNPEDFDSPILSPVQHFVLDKKDYLTVSDQFTSRILDRKGNERVKISDKFTKNSASNFYTLKKNKNYYLVTSDTLGNIIKIEVPSGKTTVQKALNSNKYHHFYLVDRQDNAQIFLFITENELIGFSESGEVILKKTYVRDVHFTESYIDDSERYVALFDAENNSASFLNLNALNNKESRKIEAYSALNIFLKEKSLAIITGSTENAVILYNIK